MLVDLPGRPETNYWRERPIIKNINCQYWRSNMPVDISARPEINTWSEQIIIKNKNCPCWQPVNWPILAQICAS